MRNYIASLKRGLFLVVLLLFISSNLFSNSFVNTNKVPLVVDKVAIGSISGFIPIITIQPNNLNICVGGTISLSVTATGTGTLTYVWKKGLVTLTNVGNISGSSTANLTISTAQVSDAGGYTCEIKDAFDNSITTSNTATVIVSPTTIPGALSGATSICIGNSAPLTLSGNNGSVVRWESSTDNWTSIISITNTNTTISTSPTITTQYRAVVQNGVCSIANSVTTTVTVDPTSVRGAVTGGTTICSGSPSGLLTLSSNNGTVVKWQSSVSPFSTWTDIINTGLTYTSVALTQTTQFRAVVQSGVCPIVNSAATTVTVDPTSVGGAVTGGTTICSGSNSGTLTLAGQIGTVVKWQSSVAPFSTWTDITNTALTFTAVALTQTTQFRAVVQSGVCLIVNSAVTTVTVDPTSVGGAVTGGTTICSGSTSGTLTLAGQTGTVAKWQSSVAPFSTWTDIINTALTYTSGPLTQSTQFRAVVQSGICSLAYSFPTTVTIIPIPTLTSSLTPPAVCSGSPFSYQPLASAGITFTWTRAVVTGISNPAGGGAGLINETLINTSNAPVSVTYDIVLSTSAPVCTNTVSIVVAVDPVPAAATTITGTQTTVCDGAAGILYTAAPILNATSYLWTLPNGTIVPTTPNTISINYLAGETSGNLRVQGVNSCGVGTATSIPITIIPPPTLSSSLFPPAVCSGKLFSYNVTSGVPLVTFTWVRNAVAGISNIAATGTNGIAETLVNTTNSPIDVIYTYTIKTPLPELCENTQNVTVTINPLPILVSSLTASTICSDTKFDYIPVSSVAGTTFSWTRVFVPGISQSTSSNNPGEIHETLTNTTDTTIAVTYVIAQTTPNLCTTTPVSIVVNVSPKPLSASIISGPSRVCAGSTSNVYSITALNNVDKYVWTLPNGSTVETTGPTITLNAMTGTLSVHARNACGNGTSSSLPISIITPPTLSSTLTPTDICSGSPFVYVPGSSNGGVAFTWTRAVVPGITNLYGTGIGAINEVLVNETSNPIPVVYTYTVTTTEGCENIQTVTVIVSRPPPTNATAISGSQSICTGATNNTYTVPVIPYATSYEWKLPNLTTVSTSTPTITINAMSGTLSVFGRNACGDGGASNLIIAVIAAPTLTSTLTPAAICSGETFEYTPTSLTFGTTFSWTRASIPGLSNLGKSGNGAIILASNETLINETNIPIDVVYRYTLTTPNNCVNIQDVTVTVNPSPTLLSSLTPPDICSGSTFNYVPTTSITGTTFSWVRAAVVGITEGSSSGSVSIHELLTNETALTIPVTYIVTLTTPSGCITTQTIVVNVNHAPLDASIISGPQRVCVTSTGNIYRIPTILNATSYVWALPNSSIVETILPTITIAAMPGNLSVHGKNSCGNGVESASYPITIVSPATLSSSLTPTAICSGDAFAYIPTSLTSGAAFTWKRAVVTGISNTTGSGSGAITPTSNEILINETNTPKNVVYSFTITTPEGCENTQNVTVVVNPSPTLLSSLTPPAICSGSIFSYTPTINISGSTYFWSRATVSGIIEGSNSGTGLISEVLTNITGASIQVAYEFTLNTGSGCSNVVTVFVVVESAPSTASTISGPIEICAGSTNNLYTVTAIPNATSYEWTLPDASTVITTSNSISINYSITDTYGNLSVHGVNSCNNGPESPVLPIIIIAPPTLSSSATPAAICSEQPFSYTPTSLATGATFSWSRNVITGISNPAGIGTGAIHETLVNTSTSPINVVYTYTITTPQGCENTNTVTVIVNPLPILTSSLTPAPICSGDTFTYTPASSELGAISWSRATVSGIIEGSNSGTGPISEVLTNITGTSIQVAYKFTLPTTGSGCSTVVTVFVAVESAPSTASTISGPIEICAGSTNNLYTVTAIPNATAYEWTLPDGSSVTTTSNSISINYALTAISGNLSVHGVNSCNNGPESPLLPVIIIVPPTLSSSATPAAICSEQPFSYTPTSLATGATFSWSRNVITGISNPAGIGTGAIHETLINTTNGSISVVYTYTITSPQGCENIDTVTVIVNPLPTLTSSLTPAPICSGDTFTYTPTSSELGAISWSRATVSGIIEGSNSGTGPISEVLTNITGASIQVAYKFTLPTTGSGCSTVVTVFVAVESAPSTASTISGPIKICAGSIGNVYTVTAIPNATSYEWTLPNASTVITTSNSISINYSLTDSSGNLSVHGVNSCNNGINSPVLPIIIIAPPTLSSSATPAAICSEQPFSYTPTSLATGATFSWSRNVITGISNGAGFGAGAINETLNNTTNGSIPVIYTYTITTPQGCENTNTVTVIVNPLPILTSSLTPAPICSGDTFTYTPASSTNPLTIAWTRVPITGISGAGAGTGTISDVLTNTTASPISVTYELILTPTGAGCSATVSIVVQVNPLPTAVVSGGGNTCLNSTNNLIVFTGANGTAPYTFKYNIGGIGAYSITTTSGNSIAVLSSSSTLGGPYAYNLIGVQDASTTTCSQAITGQSASITVESLPSLIITDPATVCENETVDLTVAAITAGSDVVPYSYYTDATATSVLLTPTAVALAGTYYIKAESSNGCSTIKPVIVTTNPIPTVTVNSPTICVGQSATISATPNPPGLYNYSWTSITGVAPGNVASFTTSIPGDYTVEITNQATPLCVSLTATGTVTVNPLPAAAILGSIPSNSKVCENDFATITFTGSLGTAGYTFEYTINGGTTHAVTASGTTATITVNTSSAGIKTIDLLSVTDASLTACKQIVTGISYTIEVLPAPTLTIINPAPICAGDTVDLQTTIIPFDNGLTYTYWTNIGATFPLNTSSAASAGTYYIKATNSAGCSSIAVVGVTEVALPTVRVNNVTICAGNVATIIATSSIPTSSSYNWIVPTGVPPPGNVASFTTSIAGNYSVYISDTNAPYCKSTTATGTVTVNPLPTATISGGPDVCRNEPLLPVVTFTGINGTAPFTFSYTLNGYTTTPITTTTGNSVTIEVPTDTAGVFEYILTNIQDVNGCSPSISGQTATVIVRDLPVVNAGNDVQVCTGDPVTLTGSGATTYTWDNGVTNGIPFTPTISTTYTVTGINSSGCESTDQVNVIVNSMPTATITGVNTYEVCKNSPEPQLLFTGANGVSPYTFTYEISSINGSPSPITKTITSSGAIATVSIATSIADVYTVTLISVEDSSAATCLNTTITEPSTATITVLESGIEPQAGTPLYQTVCEGIAISKIVFNITSSASAASTSIGAYAVGLPSGVTSNFVANGGSNGGTLSLDGIPTESGTFPYTITTTGISSNCNSSSTIIQGVIEVNAKSIISLITPTAAGQSVCENGTIQPVLYNLEGSATGANITGLPAGLTWSITGAIVTISGTVSDTPKTYTYTIESQGICDPVTVGGTITINQNEAIQLIQGDAVRTQCINTLLLPSEEIKYTAASPLELSGFLPSGMTFTPATGIISGTPTESGTFSYTISTVNACSNSLSGQIIVDVEQYISHISGDLNQIACVNTPIDPILFNVTLNVTSVEFVPALPVGINYTLNAGIIEISGNPTTAVPGSIIYAVNTTNSCGTSNWISRFTLEIIDKPTITLQSNSGDILQTICQNEGIEPIRFTLNGATDIDRTLLPLGIIASPPAPITNIIELTGSPTNTGTINFQLVTTGATCEDIVAVSITSLNSSVAIILNPNKGSDTQLICQSFIPGSNTSIEDINYLIQGATGVEVTGLPSGVSSNASATISSGMDFNLIISGTPTQSGTFAYEIKTLPCGAIKRGTLIISSPMSISAEVTQVSCTPGNAQGGSISVNITGGTPSDTGLYAINWSGPNGFHQNQATITNLAPGDYTFGGADAIGCALPEETFTIMEYEPLVSLVSITSPSCSSSCANFNFTSGSGIYTAFILELYNLKTQTWKPILIPGNNPYNICDLEIGLYRLTITDSKGCESAPYQFTIDTKNSLSIESINVDKNLCSGNSGVLTVKMNSLDTNLYFYYNDVLAASSYLGNNLYELVFNGIDLNGTLKVISSQNCFVEQVLSSNTVKKIDLDFNFTSIDYKNYGYFSVNSSIEFTNLLDISLYSPIDYNYIVWDFNDNTPLKVFNNPKDITINSDGDNIETVFHTYTNDGIYTVTLSAYNNVGCSVSITKTIVVGKGATIMLPTVFSPNYDGVNDLFRPSFNGITELSMYIYDSWGNLVYETSLNDITSTTNVGDWGWNGIEPVNSKPKNEAYRCYIIAKTFDGKTIEKTGRFLIVQ